MLWPARPQRLSPCNLLLPLGNPYTFYLSLTSQAHKVAKQQNPRPGFPERGFCSLRKGLPSLNLLRCPPRMDGPCSYGRIAPFEPAASPTQAFCYRLPGTWSNSTRLYLTQIARRSANGYRAMQLRILARKCGVNACAPARWTHSVFRACGVSCASFLLSAAGCLIEYVHVYTLHKLPGVQPMVTVQCSFASWPGRVV